jgi:translocator protein
MKKKKNFLLLTLSLFIVVVVNLIGALATRPSIANWYESLIKPSFNPPNWIFMPVWTFLYLLIALSLFLVLKTKKDKDISKKTAYWVFGTQLSLNSLWSVLFFGLHLPLIALVDLIVLWILIIFTIIKFSEINRQSAWLLVPYLIWVGFAGVLNFAIYYLN